MHEGAAGYRAKEQLNSGREAAAVDNHSAQMRASLLAQIDMAVSGQLTRSEPECRRQ
jgi:hypothetical protein